MRGGAIRRPAVAGLFYSADADALRAEIGRCFTEAAARARRSSGVATETAGGATAPKAIVVPHAGYVYSGPVAASAYGRLAVGRAAIRRVLLLGPAHRVPVRGLALSGAEQWLTPLGPVPVDTGAVRALAELPGVMVDDWAHLQEHSLEVQVPFLQTVLGRFSLVPVAVGDASDRKVAAVIDTVWDDPATVVVVSTDLSHYMTYEQAAQVDARTAAAVVAGDPAAIGDYDACGCRPLRGLLEAVAHDPGRRPVELLDLRSSGDTTGDRDRVVGYGAFAVV
ncbi:MAG: AmmeMemoRadiSam system protein B [Acidimicrobiia bacterium]|nr:AmmeMemoRadiSam system protein B [Acidimicrobiia bacterium]MDH4366442.1 AmmeMemoRadiSam system protein B [Acidimicrobiia bacterium]